MQDMLLQVLQQRSAVSVHDAFGDARRTGGKHDEQRMVEGDGFELQLGIGDKERVEIDTARDAVRRLACRRKVDYDRSFDRRNTLDDFGDHRHGIDVLAVVVVTVRGEQHARFDLPEAIDDAVGTEIRRT